MNAEFEAAAKQIGDDITAVEVAFARLQSIASLTLRLVGSEIVIRHTRESGLQWRLRGEPDGTPWRSARNAPLEKKIVILGEAHALAAEWHRTVSLAIEHAPTTHGKTVLAVRFAGELAEQYGAGR